MIKEQQEKFKELLSNVVAQLTLDAVSKTDTAKVKTIAITLLDLEYFLETVFPYTEEARVKQLTRLDAVSKGIAKLLREDVTLKNVIASILQSSNTDFSIIAALFEAKQIAKQETVSDENKAGFETVAYLGRALTVFVGLYADQESAVSDAMKKAAEKESFYPWVDNVVYPAVKSIYQKEKVSDAAATKFYQQANNQFGKSTALFFKGAFNRCSIDWFNLTKNSPLVATLITIAALPSVVGIPLLLAMFINGYYMERHAPKENSSPSIQPELPMCTQLKCTNNNNK